MTRETRECRCCEKFGPVAEDQTDPKPAADELVLDNLGLVCQNYYVCGECLEKARDKQDLLDAIAKQSEPDILCTACDWLESITGDEVPNGEYSMESIVEAVEAEDVSLLRKTF